MVASATLEANQDTDVGPHLDDGRLLGAPCGGLDEARLLQVRQGRGVGVAPRQSHEAVGVDGPCESRGELDDLVGDLRSLA